MCFRNYFQHFMYKPPKLVPLKPAPSDFQYVYQLCLFPASHGFVSEKSHEVRVSVGS